MVDTDAIPEHEWRKIKLRDADIARTQEKDTLGRTQYEKQVFEYINWHRRSNGKTDMIWDVALHDITERHAEDMGVRGYYDHISPDGHGPAHRAKEAGYECRGGAITVGENLHFTDIVITEGMLSPSTVDAWMESEQHKPLIMHGTNPDRRIRGAVGSRSNDWPAVSGTYTVLMVC